MNKKLLVTTFRNTLLTALYIFLISQLLSNSWRWFAGSDYAIRSFVTLLLFSFSAAIVGGLIFGESIILFLDNKKKESIRAAIYSICWLGVYTVLGLLVLAISK